MNMNRDIWGVFHDGVIEHVEGSFPGSVNLDLSINYLRDMFDGDGTGFKVQLGGCTQFEYCEFDELPTTNFEEIGKRQVEILYVISANPLVLDCAMGTLKLEYDSMRVTLDTGEPVSYEALVKASEKYWDR